MWATCRIQTTNTRGRTSWDGSRWASRRNSYWGTTRWHRGTTVGLEPTPLKGETAESGEDRLAGETVIEVLAGGTGEPLVGLEPTWLEGETAKSGEDRLVGETVIEVLAGSKGEPLVGLESTPEGEIVYDSESKTDCIWLWLKDRLIWSKNRCGMWHIRETVKQRCRCIDTS